MTDTVNRVLETFATLGVVRKELDGGITNVQKLLLVFDERNNGFALVDAVAEKPAKRYDVAVNVAPGVSGAGLVATSTVIAFFFVKNDFFVFDFDSAPATNFCTEPTTDTLVLQPIHLDGALDADVVFFGFEAVVLTTRYAEFKLVWKFAGKIAVVQFLGDGVGVNASAWADGFAPTCAILPALKIADKVGP